MPLCNIIDRRKRPYRWAKVEAIIEPTAHSNNMADCDAAEGYDRDAWIGYEERDEISVMEAVAWANTFGPPVTLYLYEAGTNSKHD